MAHSARPVVVLAGHPAPDGAGFEAAADRVMRAAGEPWLGATLEVADATRPADLAARLDTLAGRRVVVVPVLMNAGGTYDLVRRAVGARLGVRLCRPIGAAPAIARIAEAMAVAACGKHSREPGRTGLVLAAHGAADDPRAQATTTGHARRIAASGRFAYVVPAFLEAAPGFRDVLASAKGPAVVVALFLGHGRHVARDVAAVVARFAPRVIYAGPVGDDPAFARLVLDRARRALTRPPP
ncbi:MAG: CbiX/SirB N-terminal domain-containing protein [Alphaproteobacteria bacterium]